MEFETKDLVIQSISTSPIRDRIDPKPQYQRTEVWKPPKQAKLIDSILRGFPVPEIYLETASTASTGDYEYSVTDGQQRLRAIWAFYDNELPLGDESAENPFDDYGDISGQRYSDLPTELVRKFQMTTIRSVIIKNSNQKEIRELFRRLQAGVTVNPAEYRNSMEGNMRDFISNLGEAHNVFNKTRIHDDRFAWHDLAAIVTCLELAEGPCNVKAPDLKKMYDNEKQFNANGRKAQKINSTLNYMSRVLNVLPPEMNIKWGFVDLYLLISTLSDKYAMTQKEQQILDFYIKFEGERRPYATDPAPLLARGDIWDRDLYDYIVNFKIQGGAKDNISTRHKTYIRRFLRDNPELSPKDPQRLFDDNQKTILLRQANSKCQICDVRINFYTMHADHFPLAHSNGGPTTIKNGRALCAPCNLREGNRGGSN